MCGVKARALAWSAMLAGAAAAIGHMALRTKGGAEADLELFRTVNRGHGPGPDRFFLGVTELGSLYANVAAAGALYLLGRKREAARAMAATGSMWVLGQVLKKTVGRLRPHGADPGGTRRMIADPAGTSWPSSHPAVLTVFTRVAARELGLGPISRAALTATDLSVAASRVYLGVHYPSDVVSGLLVGRAVAHLWPTAGRSGTRR